MANSTDQKITQESGSRDVKTVGDSLEDYADSANLNPFEEIRHTRLNQTE